MATNKVKISNDYTGLAITVDASRLLTVKKINAWRKRLHASGCTSGDTLGGRGQQENRCDYADLLERADRVMATGNDE